MHDEMNQRFLNNVFTINLLQTYSAFIKDADKREGYVLGKNNHHLLNDIGKKISRIFSLHSNLTSTIEQIHFVKTFLKRYPNKEFLSKNNINQINYIQYHTEVLSHKVHTILEIMKLMVNEVYDLGIENKDCTWKAIISKLDKNTPSLKIIDKYYNTFQNIIDIRHINTHRGIYKDKKKDEIELDYGLSVYELYERIGIETEYTKNYPKFIINHKIKEYRKERLELVSKIQGLIYDLSKEFLTSLNDKCGELIKNAP